MTATRLWMVGCIAFAGLSAYLAINSFGVGFDKYAGDIRCNFISAQRDALFKFIPELRPPLQADQILAAAEAAKEPIIQRTPGSIGLIGGVEFVLTGTAVSSVRSSNF